MKNILSSLLIFAVGAGVGVAVSWKYFKDKYAKIAQEEIDSVYAAIENREKDSEDGELPSHNDEAEYVDTLNNLGYAGEEVEFMAKPHVIAPEEFGEIDDYDTETLTYYSGDEVLTDLRDNPIEDVEGMVGEDSLSHFGEYDDETVYVRNDRRQCDYEILLDTRNFSDVVGPPSPDEEE